MTTDHIEDVRGRSMADAAVGPCDCDPHIEHCPSCAPYLHEPLKPAGEEDKATYKQIADNYTSPADCQRCAELAATIRQLNREILSVGDEAEDYAGKLAALEAELKERDLQLRHLLCIIHRDGGHHTQAHGLEQSIEDAKEKFFDLRDLPDTIAQQAVRIKELETIRGNGVLVPGPELKKMQEQLAAAEKDAERYRTLKNGYFAVEQFVAYSYGWKTIDIKGLDAAIDAAIAAQKGEKL